MYIISIDPGYEGAITILSLRDKIITPIETYSIPVTSKKTKKGSIRCLDEMEITSLLCKLVSYWDVVSLVIEEQIIVGGQGISSTSINMHNYGFIKGLAAGLGLTYTIISSTKWQSVIPEDIVIPSNIQTLSKKETKKRSIAYVMELFPNYTLLKTPRSKIPSDGISDSILIGYYYLSAIIEKVAPHFTNDN
ncbi:hypothetical protein H6G33_10585 [Calothrix sp. FACHB-1219]|uniref:hypothetical protein n=1 Tax=unclassified Calothrix TaxID=2619626 RepID=UPI001689CD27|nr:MULTISPECIES: hypothetical protein [unclassified Calothrix]MBD2201794.1 hypothetical protein [Calothrix sp. FACHB-168]MBD2217480.1 hypothetical protein [Calothrix sp. FACHB-1219]